MDRVLSLKSRRLERIQRKEAKSINVNLKPINNKKQTCNSKSKDH